MEIPKWAEAYPVGSFWWCRMNSHLRGFLNLSHDSESRGTHSPLRCFSVCAYFFPQFNHTGQGSICSQAIMLSLMGQWTMILSLPSTIVASSKVS